MLIAASGTAHASSEAAFTLKGLVSGGKNLLSWVTKKISQQITVKRVIVAGLTGAAVGATVGAFPYAKNKAIKNLHKAVLQNSFEQTRQSLTGVNAYLINTPDFDLSLTQGTFSLGTTPLVYAAYKNHLAVVKLLLQNGNTTLII